MSESEKFDVLIIPYYMYTHDEIIKHLIYSNNDSSIVRYKLIYFSYNVKLDKLNSVFLNKYEYLNFNLIKKKDSSSIFFSFLYLPVLVINTILVIINIIKLRPKAIVFGTDLGGIYIRLIQSVLSVFTKIKFIVIQNTNFLDTTRRKEIEPNFPNFIRQLINLLGLNRIFYFSSDIPGSYLNNNYVLCRDIESQEIIRKTSINTIVYKNPLSIRKNKSMNFNDNRKKTLVYYTEVLDEIFDYSDVIFFYQKLFYNLKNLCFSDFKVKVKFHPRENERIVSYLIDNFSDDFEFVFNEYIVEELIINSDLTIAVSSAVIEKSLLLKVNILKINIDSDLNQIISKENIDKCISMTENFQFENFKFEYPNEIINKIVLNQY